MKLKIFALIIAILCLSMALVGCSQKPCDAHVDENKDQKCDVCKDTIPCETHTDENQDLVCEVCGLTITPPCDPHKDENADGKCDTCGGAIVVIKEQIAPETGERVPMVVNPIPSDANLADYIITTEERLMALSKAEELKIDYTGGLEGHCIVYVIEAEDDDYTIYGVYDLVAGKSLYRVTDQYTGTVANGSKTVNIKLNDYYFVSVVDTYEIGRFVPSARTVEYYTYTGEKIMGADWKSGDGISVDEFEDLLATETVTDGGVVYVTFYDNQVWTFDEMEGDYLGYHFDEKTIVRRPAFDQVCGDYGYVAHEGMLYVYDLTKWVECVYSCPLVEGFIYHDWFVLSNGNVLLQKKYVLPDDAISYDYKENGEKIDLVYTIVNLADKSTKDVEFGYVISFVSVYEDWDDLLTEKAPNLIEAYPISNDAVIYEDAFTKQLITDNDLNILFDATHWFNDMYLFDDGLFLVVTEYDDETEPLVTVVNEKGEKLAQIPYNATLNERYVLYDGKVYNFKMELLLDLSDYTVEVEFDEYAILSAYDEARDKVVYYYYDFRSKAPVELSYQTNENFIVEWSDKFGFEISYTDEEGETKYVFFNYKNVAVTVGDGSNGIYTYLYWEEDEDPILLLVMADDSYYIVRT